MFVHNLHIYDGGLRGLPLQINPKDRLGAADDQVTICGDSVVVYAACRRWLYIFDGHHGLMGRFDVKTDHGSKTLRDLSLYGVHKSNVEPRDWR